MSCAKTIGISSLTMLLQSRTSLNSIQSRTSLDANAYLENGGFYYKLESETFLDFSSDQDVITIASNCCLTGFQLTTFTRIFTPKKKKYSETFLETLQKLYLGLGLFRPELRLETYLFDSCGLLTVDFYLWTSKWHPSRTPWLPLGGHCG